MGGPGLWKRGLAVGAPGAEGECVTVEVADRQRSGATTQRALNAKSALEESIIEEG